MRRDSKDPKLICCRLQRKRGKHKSEKLQKQTPLISRSCHHLEAKQTKKNVEKVLTASSAAGFRRCVAGKRFIVPLKSPLRNSGDTSCQRSVALGQSLEVCSPAGYLANVTSDRAHIHKSTPPLLKLGTIKRILFVRRDFQVSCRFPCVKRKKKRQQLKKKKICGREAVLLDGEPASRDFLRGVRRLSTGLLALPPPPPRPSAAPLFSLSFNSPCNAAASLHPVTAASSLLHHTHNNTSNFF